MPLTARPTPAGRMPQYAPGISEPFGTKRGNTIHHGQDYFWLDADIVGSRRVFAAGAGTVSEVFWSAGMGGCISVDHGPFFTRYCHMPRDSSTVRVGDVVTDLTFLGPMGNSGTDAAGQFHLHFEVWSAGVRVNPEPFFTTTAGGNATPINEYGVPDMATRLVLASWMKTSDPANPNVYLRVHTGSKVAENSQYSQAQANQAAAIIGQPTIAVDSQAELDALLVVMGSLGDLSGPVGSADNGPVLDAISGVAAQVTALPKPPTAADIAQAVNTDAAKRLAQ